MSIVSSPILLDSESGSDSDEIEESVRVLWRKNMRLHHVEICPSEPLAKAFEQIGKLYDTPADQVELSFNDEPITRTDTLLTLGFNVVRDSFYAKQIDAQSAEATSSILKPGRNKISVKCMVKNRKTPLQYYLCPTAPLHPLFAQVATDLNVSESEVKIKFDGEYLNGRQTPKILDFEGDECLEIYT